MIAKVIKNRGAGTVLDSVNYAQREEKYQRVEKNLPQEKIAELVLINLLSSAESRIVSSEFKEINGENIRIEVNKKHSHEVISFSETDISKLDTPEKRAAAVERYLDYRGVKKENFQYIAFEHKDTKNIHIHVVYNRVGLDGEVLKARNKFETMAVACERTEKDLDLYNGIQRKVIYAPETDRGYIKNPSIEKEKEIIRVPKSKAKSLDQKKHYIQDKINEALQNKRVSNPAELKSELQKSNIDFEFKANIKGLAQTSFKYDRIAVKGSQIDFKASVIEKQFKANFEYNNIQNNNIRIAKTIFKEKTVLCKYEDNINSIIQQGKGIHTKEVIEDLIRPTKNEIERQYSAIKIKSFQDLDLKQQKYIEDLKKYEKIKSKKPQKIPLFSFNKSEIIKENEELKKLQNQAKSPQLPKYDIISIYEETRQKALYDLQVANVKPKNTYEMEKTHSKSMNQEQGLNSTQQRLLDKVKERQQEQNQEQMRENKRGLLR